MPDIRLVVASPNMLVIRGIVDLASTMQGVIVVASARAPESLASVLAMHQPEVLVVDADMIEAAHGLSLGALPMRVLLLGVRSHLGIEPAFIPQFACGYFNERDAASDVFDALQIVTGCDLPQPLPGAHRCGTSRLRQSLEVPRLPLSEREYDVFLRIGLGQGATVMAGELGISVKTIETHRESIKRKLQLGSARALNSAALAWRRGDDVG